jgi:hypothetical protein
MRRYEQDEATLRGADSILLYSEEEIIQRGREADIISFDYQ